VTNALAGARTALSAALAPVGVPVHKYPPQALQPPCLVLLPGSPWIAPRGHVTLEIAAYAAAVGGADAMAALEQLVEDTRDALFTAGVAPQNTEQPTLTDDAGVMQARTPVTIRTTCH
jgi:hypothetical protein